MIDNSEATELVQNNSQWHPGFNIDMVPPALQTAVQTPEATTTDQGLQIEDGAEDEADDETDEEMDDTNSIDDAFDEDAWDLGEEADLMMGLEETFNNDPTLQPHAADAVSPDPLSQTIDPTAVEHIQSDQNPILEDEDPDLPNPEEIPVAHQHTAEGNEQLQHDHGQFANNRLRRGRR